MTISYDLDRLPTHIHDRCQEGALLDSTPSPSTTGKNEQRVYP